MSKTTTLSIRIDPGLKSSVQQVLAHMGLTTSEAVNIFLMRVQKEKAIPFVLRVPNATTKKALDDSRAGKNIKNFNSMNELFDDLDK